MKLDIPYYIRQVLRERRMVYIPGIGTLRLLQNNARFNDDKSLIIPPQLNISFEDADSDDNFLLKYILDTGLLTEAKAKEKIEEFTQSALNQLMKAKSFSIDGVGSMVKKAGKNKVEFESNVADLTREFSDLVSLKLTPISRIVQEKALASKSEVSPEIDESGSYLPRIILLTLFLIALYFIGSHLYSYFNEPKDEITEIIGTMNAEDSAATTELNEKELQQKYEEIDELIAPLNEKDNKQVTDTSTDQTSSQRGEDTDSGQEDPSAVDAVGSNEDSNSQEFMNDSDLGDKGLNESLVDSKNKHADIIPESGECIIIVGSFIKSLNTIKMVSLLERKGYKVHQSEYKGFTRVGIKYNCANVDLEDYLQDIRKKISKRAWYLEPDLDVPYLSLK
jgi:hypothetical protein